MRSGMGASLRDRAVTLRAEPVVSAVPASIPGASYQTCTILADPPWRFTNRTGKMAPEHKRLSRYDTMTLEEI